MGKFHDIRGDVGGICHQILPENGYVRPGYVVVGTDSHTTSHGALGAFAFGIGATEMASVWALGSVLNVEVPATIKVVVTGRFKKFVGPKDLILHLIGKISAQGANFKVLEFHGETIRDMSTSGRLVLCNMAVEAGATAGIVPADEETARYLREEAGVTDPIEPVLPDPDAAYESVIEIKASKLQPQIACPHTVDNVKPIDQVAGKKVNQIVIGSCTNGRLDDLAIAAKIMKGQKVAPHTRMLIFPASAKIFRQALGKGYVGRLHAGRRRGDELRLRPLPGHPRRRAGRRRSGAVHHQPELQGPHGQPELRSLSLFPGRGRRLGHHRRHHRSEEEASHARFHVSHHTQSFLCLTLYSKSAMMSRPTSSILAVTWPPCCPPKRRSSRLRTRPPSTPSSRPKQVPPGSIVVGGKNFGCGSSREQAASCLKGHELIIVANDFARIFLQNGINLGLRMIVCPGIEAAEGDDLELTPEAVINKTSGKQFKIEPLPKSRQVIIDAGGLIPYTRKRLLEKAAA